MPPRPSATEPPDDQKVWDTLNGLKNAEALITPDNASLGLALTRLLAEPETAAGQRHWFCDLGKPILRECATYLVVLFTYSAQNSRVASFLSALQATLLGCMNCSEGFQQAKLDLRNTYFSQYPTIKVNDMIDMVQKWECQIISDAILASPTPAVSVTILHHFLVNAAFTSAPCFAGFVLSRLTRQLDPPAHSPGLLMLLFHFDSSIRDWAYQRINTSNYLNRSACIKESYSDAIRRILAHIPYLHDDGAGELSNDAKFFTRKPDIYWSTMTRLIEKLPPDMLKDELDDRNVVLTVITHLGDAGSHFAGIFRSFILLLKNVPSILLEAEATSMRKAVSTSSPSRIFDAIKDNQEFLRRMEKTPDKTYLSWLLPYLNSIPAGGTQDIFFQDVLAKMAALCFEELQHPRFYSCGPLALEIMVEVLYAIIDRESHEETVLKQQRLTIVKDAVERHGELLLSVAFSQEYLTKDSWKQARQATRRLIEQVLAAEISLLENGIIALAVSVSSLDGKKKELQKAIDAKRAGSKAAEGDSRTLEKLQTEQEALPTAALQKVAKYGKLRPRLWPKLYEVLLLPDADAFRIILGLIGRVAAYADLVEKAYIRGHGDIKTGYLRVWQSINYALSTIRSGFVPLCTRFCDATVKPVLETFIGADGTVEDLIACIFSPIKDFQDGALQVIGQIYYVDVRDECLRAVFKAFPERSRQGTVKVLARFVKHIDTLMDACESAKTLVRALTDVVAVFCTQDVSQQPGLFFDDSLRKRLAGQSSETNLAALWRFMAQAIGKIFKHTPIWSAYYDDEALKVWLRDALIFARDLAKERRIFQAVVSQQYDKEGEKSNSALHLLSPNKMHSKARRMVNDLQIVLLGALRWLRLTDSELLHQSFSLIETLFDVFKAARITPDNETLKHLKSVVDHALRSPDLELKKQSRLSKSQIQWLVAKNDEFTEGEDDQEIQELESTATRKPMPQKQTTLVPIKAAKPDQKPKVEAPPPPPSAKPRNAIIFQKSGASSSNRTIIPPLPKITPRPPPPPPVQRKVEPAKKEAAPSRSSAADSDSDSTSESESEGEPGGALTAKQKSPEKVKERRGIVLLGGTAKLPTNVQNRVERHTEAQRALLRLKPDLSGLHKMILSWDYDALGERPPDIDESKLLQVPDRFQNMEQYMSIFKPLLCLEVWSQLMKSKDEQPESVSCFVGPKAFIDSYVEMELQIPRTPINNWFLSETDICLLRQTGNKKSFLCKVESAKRTAQRYVVNTRFLGSKGTPNSGESWQLSKVFSLSTVHREYGALLTLTYYDMCADILSARLSHSPPPSPSAVKRAMQTYKVNEPQAIAILSALATNGFSLIQGPPGTGKTWTICGMVGEFLTTRGPQATTIQPGKATAAGRILKKKILLCAPSNAAIDEVAKRICGGIIVSGKQVVPSVIRVGAEGSINISAREISLDALIQKRLNTLLPGSSGDGAASPLETLRNSLEKVKNEIAEKRQEMDMPQTNSARALELNKELRTLQEKKAKLAKDLNACKDQQSDSTRNMDAARRRIRTEILTEADIICCTLSGAGHEMLAEFDFDTVIIDEAAQAIELSSLIPLKFSSKRCILVGDPKQLPPTVISPIATRFRYNNSLFARIEKLRPEGIHLLSIQYRMHPDISALPSALFYDGRLQNGPGMDIKTQQSWHANSDFRPYRFFNIEGNEEVPSSGHSYINRNECTAAAALYNRLVKMFPDVNFDRRIGIVSMYRAQVLEMKRHFESRFGRSILDLVDFNTVDGFQGQEKDIIILSCVRGGPRVEAVGFLADERRMNVAITRSRSSLFILGHAATLERSNETWKKIVTDARTRGFLIKADKAYFERAMPTPGKPASPTRSPTKIAKQPSLQKLPKLLTPKEASKAPAQSKSSPPSRRASTSTLAAREDAKAISLKEASKPNAQPPACPIPDSEPKSVQPDPIPPKISLPKAETGQVIIRKQKPSAFIPKKKRPAEGSSDPAAKRLKTQPPGN